MEPPKLKLSLLPDLLAVCRLEHGQEIPAWATKGGFFSLSRIREELSVICASNFVPENIRASRGWRAIKIEGPLDLDLVGILVSVAVPLAHAGIGILPVGTFDTDYILVRDRQLGEALKALRATGFNVLELGEG
ncbi:MAG TPA: ACT domain-containing protein [Chthoniobacterales bacterium]|nr:ACT domain-containing protein [Chthoniobacterales bacterium]